MKKRKRIIFTFGNKGGAGKSMTARSVAEILRAAGMSPLLVDADPTVGHLVKYLGERTEPDEDGKRKLILPQPPTGVRTYELHGNDEDRTNFGDIIESGRDLILVDCPAASATLLGKIEKSYGLLAWAHEAGYDVTLVVSITPDDSSMNAVLDAHELDPKADLVVVRNGGFGDLDRHFVVWDGSDPDGIPTHAGKILIEKLGLAQAKEIRLPDLDHGTLALIGACLLTFQDAASGAVGARGMALQQGQRRRQVRVWLNEARAAYATCGDMLGFASADEVTA